MHVYALQSLPIALSRFYLRWHCESARISFHFSANEANDAKKCTDVKAIKLSNSIASTISLEKFI